MPATLSIQQVTGPAGSPITTPITNLRLNTDDTANPGTNNPMVKPSVGILRSYWKTIYLNADTSPSGTINNCKIYSDGAIGWAGCTLYVGATDTYTQATGTPGVTGDDSSVATADIQNYTQGSPKNLTGRIDNPATGRITDYVVMQNDLQSTVSPGRLPAETIIFQSDQT